MSTFQIFPNFGRGGGGHRKSNFSQIQNSPHYPRGGGQENYGLFPQFGTFFFYCSPNSVDMIMKSSNSGRNLLIFSESPNIEQQAWKTF